MEFPELTKYQKATFAGGCFWCMEPPFEKLAGVIDVISGYTGGTVPNPDYEGVCSGKTGHYEAIQVIYDPAVINYEQLLDVFWRQVDPTDPHGQFADRGSQYRTAIFFHDENQRVLAMESKEKMDPPGDMISPLPLKYFPPAPFIGLKSIIRIIIARPQPAIVLTGPIPAGKNS